MPSTKNVYNTRISSADLQQLHGAVLDIVAAIVGPQRDELLIREAGIRLDRALFPLLVLIGRMGPVGVVDLAERVGRDHSTVSRQVTKLEDLGLVTRRAGADRRVREAVLSAEGEAMAALIDAARERLLRSLFADWSGTDLDALVRLMRRFADQLLETSRAGS
jgi:DNA-binding MarR family transcriptional regulator